MKDLPAKFDSIIHDFSEKCSIGIILMNESGDVIFNNCNANIAFSDAELIMSDSSISFKDLDGNGIREEQLPFVIARQYGVPVINFQAKISHKNGSERFVFISSYPLESDVNTPCAVISPCQDCFDIPVEENYLKVKFDRLQRNEQLFLDAQKITHVGHWEYLHEEKSSTCTPEIANIFGSSEALSFPLGVSHRKYYSQKSYNNLNEELKACLEHGASFQLELEINTDKKQKKDVLIHGQALYDSDQKIIGCAGIVQDVTELRKAELELAELQVHADKIGKRYHGLLVNLETGVVVHGADTSIITCNTKSTELLGLTEDQMRGLQVIDPYWKFIDEDGNKVFIEDYPVMSILRTMQPMKNQVFGVCRPGKEVTWLLVNGFPVFKTDSIIEEVVVSFIDVSQRVNAQKELLRAKEKAEEASLLKLHLLKEIETNSRHERERIAQKLHDNIIQQLASVTMELKSLAIADSNSNEILVLNKKLKNIKSQLQDISHQLKHADVDGFTLNELFQQLKDQSELYEPLKLQFSIDLGPKSEEISLKVKSQIYNITQELIAYVLKDSKAMNAYLNVEEVDDEIHMSVADDGVGMDRDEVFDRTEIQSINQRVLQMNGKMVCNRDNSQSVKVIVPIDNISNSKES